MNKILGFIFGLIILSLIILIILLWVKPSESKIYGSIIGSIATIITITLGYLYIRFKKCDCKCGKGDCNKCGGINEIGSDIKQKINAIIRAIRSVDDTIPESRESATDQVNQIFQQLGWVQCGTQEDVIHFLHTILGQFNNTTQINDMYIFEDMQTKLTNIQDLQINNILINKMESYLDYKLFGIIIHNGNNNAGHYTTYVEYNNGWFLCNDNQDPMPYGEGERGFSQILANLKIKGNNTIKLLAYKKTNVPLKEGIPIKLVNLGQTCYSNSALQILMATNLLDEELIPVPVLTPASPAPVPTPASSSTEEEKNELIKKARDMEIIIITIITEIKKLNEDTFQKLNHKVQYLNTIINRQIIHNLTNNPGMKLNSYDNLFYNLNKEIKELQDTLEKLKTSTPKSIPPTPESTPPTPESTLPTPESTLPTPESTPPTPESIPPVPTPALTLVPSVPTPVPSVPAPSVPASTLVPASVPGSTLTSYSSSLPIYDVTSTQVKEYYQKNISNLSTKNKLEQRETEFDNYLNNLLKESI